MIICVIILLRMMVHILFCRKQEAVKKGPFFQFVICGEVATSALQQTSAVLDHVSFYAQ